MKFPHEYLQDSIASFERAIERTKERLRDPAWQRKAGVLWEIDRDINLHPLTNSFWTTPDDEDIRIYFHKSVSIEAFNDLFDSIEESFEEHGFKLSMEPAVTHSTASKYYFVNDKGDKVPLVIDSGVCKQVNTGRMVPETKTECSFLEG